MMQVRLDPGSVADYRRFLRIKSLPTYRLTGTLAEFPDEYAARVGMEPDAEPDATDYAPHPSAFDYQRAIAASALRKRRFCIFADCGLGKTLIYFDWLRHVAPKLGKSRGALLVSPAMVVDQTIEEAESFYGDDLRLERVAASDLKSWLRSCGGRIGITNYEAIRDDLERGRLGAMVLDESSYLKSHYGKWGTKLIELGRGLSWKLAGTGTPAPNDRIEYANHAVFMDAFPTVNSFLARYFVNRGQTGERWELKGHALRPFYRSLSHWSIFLTDPRTYGWSDNADTIPPIHVHVHRVELTPEQERLAFNRQGTLFASELGGIATRASFGQIAKGHHKGRDVETNKPAYIRKLIETWPDESTLVWCIYNREQELLEKEMPAAASIKGSTPMDERLRIVADFKSGRVRTLITKPKILGFGLNLQIATRQVFSGLQDSYEQYYQAVKRSNRVGSTRPLNVHIPVTDIEEPMVENVLRKAHRVEQDAREQERLFREVCEP